MLGGVAIHFQGPSTGVADPSASLGCGSGPTSNWSKIGCKYKLRWMLRWESGFQGGCPNRAGWWRAPGTSSPWSFTDWLYFLCLRLVDWRFNNPSPDCSGELQGRWSVDSSASNVRATGVWVCLIWRATGLLKDLHTWADPWQGTQCGDKRCVRLFLASSEGRRKSKGEALFVHEFWTALRNLLVSSDLSRPLRELYRELVVGSATDPLSERRGWMAKEIRSHWNRAPASCFLNNSEFSIN